MSEQIPHTKTRIPNEVDPHAREEKIQTHEGILSSETVVRKSQLNILTYWLLKPTNPIEHQQPSPEGQARNLNKNLQERPGI